jgi:hypothetical protein
MTINFDPRHAQEFQASAIADDIAALNFRSFDGNDDNDLDKVFTQIIEEPTHNNNGTLSGKSQNDLANVIRGGGWIFEGYRGICIKPDNPRKNNEGKIIRYESPRSQGQQLFIPKVSIKAGKAIASKHGLEEQYRARIDFLQPEAEDVGFWEWVLSSEIMILVTEGCKKACSVISHGYPAIALNGIWGWGTNIKDMFGEVERDDRGKSLKTIHPDLEPFLDGRELVLAFDRDEKPETKRIVEAAKTAFTRAIDDDGIVVTQLTWRIPKGIDDYIAAKGVKALDRLYGNRKELKPAKPQKEERTTAGDTLIEIGRTATYFHTSDKVAYADIYIDGNRHTYKVRSSAFRLWLTGEYFKQTGKGISAQPMQDTLNTLEAIALFGGETRDVHLRTAQHQGKIYLDLGTDDWKAVEVDSNGWRIVSDPPVRFWRPNSLLNLPVPIAGGKLDELRDLLNVDDSSWVQIVTFLMFCYCPLKRYPVLVLSAIRGSGKTTAAEIIKGLIDPGKAPLIPLPSKTRDLAVAASRRWLMAYDNVSHISNDESDNLCKLSTGFGFTARKLHTDDEETIIECTRPQMITAIDGVVAREDLGDRVLLATLREITPDRRLSASELEKKIYDSRPKIFGALLTALSQTLAKLPYTRIVEPPRMVDYALFSVAAESALGLEDGTFLAAFKESRDRIRESVIESSPVGEAILSLMKNRSTWKGTASELLSALSCHVNDSMYRSRFFPKAANRLKAQLNRLAPDLKTMNIYFSETAYLGSKKIVLEKVSTPSTPSTPNEPKALSEAKKSGVDTQKSIDTNQHQTESIDTRAKELKEITPSEYISSGVDTQNSIDTRKFGAQQEMQESGVDSGVDGVDTQNSIDTRKFGVQQEIQDSGVDGVDTFTSYSGNNLNLDLDPKPPTIDRPVPQIVKVSDRLEYCIDGDVFRWVEIRFPKFKAAKAWREWIELVVGIRTPIPYKIKSDLGNVWIVRGENLTQKQIEKLQNRDFRSNPPTSSKPISFNVR